MIRKMLCVLIWLVAALALLVVSLYLYNTKIIESNNPRDVAPASTKFVDIGGEQIAYSEIDNKASTTVIFVGGLSAWNGTWERVVHELNTKRQNLNYIVIDLPPFGYSIPDAEKKYYRDIQAERLASFIASKEIQSVILVGHSYGGGPVTEYALKHQERVEKLILIDAVLNIDEGEKVPASGPIQIDSLRDLLIGSLIHNDVFALSRLKTFVYITDYVDQALLDIYTDYFKTKGVTSRLSSWFKDYVNDPLDYQSTDSASYKEIKFPVRLIWGDKDTLTPIAGTEILLATIPDIGLIILKDIGHIPMIEDYAQFDTALLEALTE